MTQDNFERTINDAIQYVLPRLLTIALSLKFVLTHPRTRETRAQELEVLRSDVARQLQELETEISMTKRQKSAKEDEAISACSRHSLCLTKFILGLTSLQDWTPTSRGEW